MVSYLNNPFSVENSQNSYTCISRKRCFLILLLVNCFLACIYYIHVQKQPKSTIQNLTTYTKQIRKNLSSKQPGNKAMRYIRRILENEYDLNDLATFYNFVDKEFSSGLRCMRKPNKPPSPPTTTTTITILNNSSYENNSNLTTTR